MPESLVVTCLITNQKYELDPTGLDSEIIEGLVQGEIGYLSKEARDNGWSFFTQLSDAEVLEYRQVREVGGDLLMRHLRYFVTPRDITDERMK